MDARKIALFVLIAALTLSGINACGGEENYGLPTLAPAKDSAAQDEKLSSLERKAESIGVKKLENGHLLVVGDNANLRFSRLLTYLNMEARDTGKFYKVSGFYGGGVTENEDYGDPLNLKVQFSFDDFPTHVLMAQPLKDLSAATSYEKLNAILADNNARAAASGRDYKMKGWYETKEISGKLVSDRVDIVIHFSFDAPFERYTPGTSISARITFPGNERRNAIIAQAAVEFSQLLKEPKELTVVTLDFAGEREHGPEFVYVFDRSAIGTLKRILNAEEKFNARDILALAEIKERAQRVFVRDNPTKRSKEPVGEKEAKIIAYIAVETARVIRPTKLLIVVHDFPGASPNQLTTWAYIFDRAAIESLRKEDLEPGAVLQKAHVAEQAGVVPGNRIIPPMKPIIP